MLLERPGRAFGRPKHRAKSRPGTILVTLAVKERVGHDFRSIFWHFWLTFERFLGVCGLVRNVALWTLFLKLLSAIASRNSR